MSVCFNVIFAWKCSSTHHKLAMDALRHLRCPQSEDWTNLCLRYIEFYLDGSKAPDNKFKDFRNHVLHVRDNMWGGAIGAAESWYARTVEALRQSQWTDAIYAAGVLSHYFTDPVQPFHTGQSEAEGVIHRAAEWSIAKSYEELQNILEQDLGGYADVEVPNRPDWLAEMIRQGAKLANPHYETLIDHYDLKAGMKNPPAGLDQVSKDILAPLIGYAAVGFARVFERAIEEAQAMPPMVAIELQSLLNTMTVPIYAITKKIRDVKERIQVEAMYREFERSGKVIFTLPEDDKAIRRAHAEEVLNKSLAELDAERIKSPGQLHGTGAPARQTSRNAITHPVSNYAPPLVASAPVTVAPLRAALPTVRREPISEKKVAPAPMPARPAKALRPAEPVRPTAPSEPLRAVEASVRQLRPEKPASPVRRERPRMLPAVAAEPKPEFIEQPAAETTKSSDKTSRFYLDRSMPLDKAPSIGNKTASRFEKIGVLTVAEFLELDPEVAARKLNVKHIDAVTIRQWQSQARLACRIPNIRGHDAQILVACGVEDPDKLSAFDPQKLLTSVLKYCATSEGQRILRSSPLPDLEEINEWIDSASQARALRAA